MRVINGLTSVSSWQYDGLIPLSSAIGPKKTEGDRVIDTVYGLEALVKYYFLAEGLLDSFDDSPHGLVMFEWAVKSVSMHQPQPFAHRDTSRNWTPRLARECSRSNDVHCQSSMLPRHSHQSSVHRVVVCARRPGRHYTSAHGSHGCDIYTCAHASRVSLRFAYAGEILRATLEFETVTLHMAPKLPGARLYGTVP